MTKQQAEWIAGRSDGEVCGERTACIKGHWCVRWCFGPFHLDFYEETTVSVVNWQPIDAATAAGLHGKILEIDSALADARAAGILPTTKEGDT